MNLLTIQTETEELIDIFPDQLMFLSKILGENTTEEQLEAVQHYLTNSGWEEMNDMIEASLIGGEIEGDSERFKTSMNLLLLELQTPLGSQVVKLRGSGSSNEL